MEFIRPSKRYSFSERRILNLKLKEVANILYVITKPIEWIFLIIIYLHNTKLENLIVVHYLPYLHNLCKHFLHYT